MTPRNATADKVEQSAYRVPKDHKRHLLAHLINEGNWHQVLVFTRTKHGANRLTQQLERAGINAMAIHGNKSQNARVKALQDFKDNRITALVATEVAARGLDIKELPHVVNYELPNVPEDYVHRIGRTARAGSTGAAISLVSPDEVGCCATSRRCSSARSNSCRRRSSKSRKARIRRVRNRVPVITSRTRIRAGAPNTAVPAAIARRAVTVAGDKAASRVQRAPRTTSRTSRRVRRAAGIPKRPAVRMAAAVVTRATVSRVHRIRMASARAVTSVVVARVRKAAAGLRAARAPAVVAAGAVREAVSPAASRASPESLIP